MGVEEINALAKASFRRSWANLMSAARTAKLSSSGLEKVVHLENGEVLEDALHKGGVVLLLSHMGNWEVLSRLVRFFPEGSRAGAFYRPLNNPLLDRRVLARRQADGTRMFSKRDNPLHVATFLREGGIVGILADQRVGLRGEVVEFFGRITRSSPLPSLLARRSKSTVLALSLTTEACGRWKASFVPVSSPPTTHHCMEALEQAMICSPIDVFWLQDRWKTYVGRERSFRDWLSSDTLRGSKPHRALLWLSRGSEQRRISKDWMHPDLVLDIVLETEADRPEWISRNIRCHRINSNAKQREMRKLVGKIGSLDARPLDFLMSYQASRDLSEVCQNEVIPHVLLS